MTLRVGLDVTPELFAATGVARYSRELGRELDRRDDCEVVRFAIGRRTVSPSPGTRRLPVPLRAVHPAWRWAGLPRAEHLCGRVDVVHSVDLLAPPTRRPVVLTVHDLAAIEHPKLHSPRTVALQRRRMAQAAAAQAVLAVSAATRDALLARGVPAGRVHVTPLGLTRLPPPVEPPLPPGPMVLSVGTREPRKRHELLIRAFANVGGDARLVLAGPPAGRDGLLRDLATRVGVAERMTILGPVDDAALAGLYARASVACTASQDEGFGLPVLEAMSIGVPVLVSNVPALRELTGEAGLTFAPGDVDALADGLRWILSHPAEARALGRRGRERAAAYTWAATAETTMAAYRAAINEWASARD